MRVSEVCSRDVVFVRGEESVLEATRLMERFHVGDVVVVWDEEGHTVPVAILTDRDVAVRVVARDLAPRDVRVAEVASRDLLKLTEEEGVYEAIDRMRAKGVRRAPVVSLRGDLVGILSVDDLLEVLAEEITGLVRLIRRAEAEERGGVTSV